MCREVLCFNYRADFFMPYSQFVFNSISKILFHGSLASALMPVR